MQNICQLNENQDNQNHNSRGTGIGTVLIARDQCPVTAANLKLVRVFRTAHAATISTIRSADDPHGRFK